LSCKGDWRRPGYSPRIRTKSAPLSCTRLRSVSRLAVVPLQFAFASRNMPKTANEVGLYCARSVTVLFLSLDEQHSPDARERVRLANAACRSVDVGEPSS
jgi:hypothetical protein